MTNKPTSKEREEAIRIIEKARNPKFRYFEDKKHYKEHYREYDEALQTLISIAKQQDELEHCRSVNNTLKKEIITLRGLIKESKQQEVGREEIEDFIRHQDCLTANTDIIASALKDKFIITRRSK